MLKSKMMSVDAFSNKVGISPFHAIALSVLFQAGSGICGKYAAIYNHGSLLSTVFNVFYMLSLLFLVLQAFTWQLALVHYPVSYAFPFLSTVNFVILAASAILFREEITAYNIAGLILISLGIYALSGDSEANL